MGQVCTKVETIWCGGSCLRSNTQTLRHKMAMSLKPARLQVETVPKMCIYTCICMYIGIFIHLATAQCLKTITELVLLTCVYTCRKLQTQNHFPSYYSSYSRNKGSNTTCYCNTKKNIKKSPLTL